MNVDLFHAPDCPNAATTRELVLDCLAEADDIVFAEHIGDYRSPSVLVDGVDVMDGGREVAGTACRLDLPTRERLLAAFAARG
ncbi:alkylmercury lyase [Actinokineospora xionganensis]|uniref:Alkylmercury lyase n=1 Tax=Actinokineospora xionganensis TaxID=2684470 RepID=A0ABR7LEX5_9PSEU|nr:alkylmercury lyase [Actinokineospora xionganensis]MBC6451276.1 alkylmercury lyase [Actinokineospora xionganensis]